MIETIDKAAILRARIAEERHIILSNVFMPIGEWDIHVRRINILRFRLAVMTNEKHSFAARAML